MAEMMAFGGEVGLGALRVLSPGAHFVVELVVLILQRGGCYCASTSGRFPLG
jgi:hypothetical protein